MTAHNRKIILFVASSLDGYIARNDGDVGWLFTDADYGFVPFMQRIDAILMGRKTYDITQILGYPGDVPGYVFSNTRHGTAEHVEFVSAPVADFTRELQQQPGKDIWLMGGGEIVRELLNANLIDEVIIAIHPILLGDGIPLVAPGATTRHFNLTNLQRFDNGLVILSYERKR